ncbi:AtzE family amidohydrolase [Acidihalobacter ferrooxydans]|uniref:Amidase n=1 Tax=Acidihalobacter ferrooxydans TaxID=1765967 RepID=A0A1P8UHM6_9GAMM|nr:AtzE family amidohydrolase [Acidihalobacter ferrooxydans]APZ43274.1 amidase [Acidihalobacter ferrooxydans]
MSALPKTGVELAAAIRAGELSATEATQATLTRIEQHNPGLGAFTDITAERALREAAEVDRRRARGSEPGPLAGVPYAVKNLYDIEGMTTLAGSKINRDDPPAREDATLISRLKQAGAILCGGLNMGEYAYDFTGENAHVGPSRNPHNPAHMTGGSSGGSGAAVGANLVPLALGSDTNGSIRVPASLCGIFGLKPTFGRLSRAGSFAFCPSLDHLGPLARSVADLAASYDAMQGPDIRDPVCQKRLPETTAEQLGQGADGLRIAVAGGYFRQQGTPQAFAAVERVARTLGVDTEAELPEAGRARAAAYLITNAESSNLHLDRLRARAADYDPDVRDRMLAGALLPADWYLQAQRFRRWYQHEVLRVFRRHDVLIAPATPMTAPPIGQRTMTLEGQEMLVRPHLGLYTQPISFIGLPVVVVPVQTPGELPIGVQIIAAPWREEHALRVAAQLEAEGFTAPEAALD